METDSLELGGMDGPGVVETSPESRREKLTCRVSTTRCCVGMYIRKMRVDVV